MANRQLITIIIVAMAITGFSMAVLGTGTSPLSTGSLQKASGEVTSGSNSSSPLINTSGQNFALNQSLNSNGNASHEWGFSRNNLFLPNPNVKNDYKIENSVITPTYNTGPAPVGVSDIGVKSNATGSLTSYNLSSNSIEGSITVNNMSAFYPPAFEANNVTFQLNTVLKNVTVLGNDSFSYWTQNVVVYSTTQHTISFEDNIWNSSSPEAVMTANTIYGSTGNVLPYPGVHIASGPTYQLTLPFTLNLYLNSSVMDNMNAVWFNYSLPQMGIHGTYDRVLFNSSYGEPSTFHTKQSDFFISGSTPAPNGLLYDAELIIGGPGGGSNTNMMAINATMQLKYNNATTNKLTSVPSAINFGVDTGETSIGISTYWTSNDVVHLSSGPTLFEYMWGISSSSHEGFMKITGSVSQSSAFLFITNGYPNLPVWSPLKISGKFTYLVSPGNYTSFVLLNNYNISARQFDGVAGSTITWNFELNRSTEPTIYTPVYAFNNAQLKEDSIGGNGSVISPYILPEVNSVYSLFGEMNDFGFPVFSTYELVNTSSISAVPCGSPLTISAVYNNSIISYDLVLPIIIYGSSNIQFMSTDMYELSPQFPNENGFFYAIVDIYYSSAVTFYNLQAYSVDYPIFVLDSSNVAFIQSSLEFTEYAIISCYSYVSIGSSYLEDSYVCNFAGQLNLTNVETCCISLYSYAGDVNYFGATIYRSEVISTYSDIAFTGVTVYRAEFGLQNSSLTQMNVNGEQMFLGAVNSTVNENSSTYTDNSQFELINSTIYMNNDAISESSVGLLNSNLIAFASNVFTSHVYVEEGSFSINGGSELSGSLVELYNSTNDITSSLVNYTQIGVCYGDLNVVQSTFSSDWSIITFYSTTKYMDDTFLTVNNYNSYECFCGYPVNTIEVNGGMNSIENSLFYSANSNTGSSIELISGNNIIEGNTFESYNISTMYNPNGAGSALITYGGNNQISGNSFITLSAGAQSLYIKDGDISTQSGNQYFYNVNFTETGLTQNSNWTLSIDGHTYTSSNNYINVLLSTGTYTYTVSSSGYNGQNGTVKVSSSAEMQPVTFTKLSKYSVTFEESGLPALTNWTVTFDGHTYTTSAQSITITGVTTGTYAYSTGSFSKYYAPSSKYGNISVTSDTTQTINFSGVMYSISFHESGLNSNANWTVVVNGNTYYSNGLSTITLNEPIGSTVTYTIGNQTGYVSSAKNGNFPVSGNYTVAVQFVKSGISPTLTYIGIAIAAIVGLAVGAAVMYIFRSSAKKPAE